MYYQYEICLSGCTVGIVTGHEAAWHAYKVAEELAEALGLYEGAAALIDHQTGEVLADSSGYRA